jgi:hypothetical protein
MHLTARRIGWDGYIHESRDRSTRRERLTAELPSHQVVAHIGYLIDERQIEQAAGSKLGSGSARVLPSQLLPLPESHLRTVKETGIRSRGASDYDQNGKNPSTTKICAEIPLLLVRIFYWLHGHDEAFHFNPVRVFLGWAYRVVDEFVRGADWLSRHRQDGNASKRPGMASHGGHWGIGSLTRRCENPSKSGPHSE